VNVMEERFILSKYGKQLWTRELAKRIRAELVEKLADLEKGSTLVIDAKGVEVFDYSFANELFGKTAMNAATEFPDRFVVVEHLTEYTRENLGKALEALGVAMIERRKEKPELIGKFHPADQETFQALVEAREPVSAGALSKKLGVNLTAMNERLAKLSGLGLARREKGSSAAGREQYEYQVLR
jgi:hypothetical protein